MSEEKLERYWNKVYYEYLEREEAQELIDYYKNMEQRIDKAIEYIKTQQKIFEDYDIVVDNQLKNILGILGGK